MQHPILLGIAFMPSAVRIVLGAALAIGFAGLGVTFIAPPDIKEALIPQTGWSAGSYYLSLALMLVFGADASARAARGMLLLCLYLFVLALPIVDYLTTPIDRFSTDERNPYLRIGEMRWAWSVALPLLLGSLMLLPSSLRYLRRQQPKGIDESPVPDTEPDARVNASRAS